MDLNQKALLRLSPHAAAAAHTLCPGKPGAMAGRSLVVRRDPHAAQEERAARNAEKLLDASKAGDLAMVQEQLRENASFNYRGEVSVHLATPCVR